MQNFVFYHRKGLAVKEGKREFLCTLFVVVVSFRVCNFCFSDVYCINEKDVVT